MCRRLGNAHRGAWRSSFVRRRSRRRPRRRDVRQSRIDALDGERFRQTFLPGQSPQSLHRAALVFKMNLRDAQEPRERWLFPGEIVVIAGYYVINWVRSGQTLGMRAWRLRAVDASGKPLQLGPAALRFLCGVLAWAPAALGVLWLYLDAEHLAMHDRLSRTRVVRLSGSR